MREKILTWEFEDDSGKVMQFNRSWSKDNPKPWVYRSMLKNVYRYLKDQKANKAHEIVFVQGKWKRTGLSVEVGK